MILGKSLLLCGWRCLSHSLLEAILARTRREGLMCVNGMEKLQLQLQRIMLATARAAPL